VLPFSIVSLDEDWSRRKLQLVCRSSQRLEPHVRKLFDALEPAPLQA